MRLFLASESPRRRQLLKQLVADFEVETAEVCELDSSCKIIRKIQNTDFEGKILDNCEVIESATTGTKVVDFGSNVKILDLTTDEEDEYLIVNTIEVNNVLENKISVESPLAKAIIGHQVGDVVTVSGPVKYDVKIVEIN